MTEKCTLCVHRLEKGQRPACVDTCIARTRFFGEMDDMVKMIRKKRATRVSLGFIGGETTTNPSVIYTR